ncbi:FlgD immunoglobulin-like domain containing protein [Cesiribacter sp. SM1]|uniref:FlgD immunoglobulin-like domain containing protein n=1 Tax=Cesiribacter sp. SM1 TaxID=2861196 RepID=UPI001CD278DE|nr:FlgD immunoglobulin-like domain containing protein [Cesiribacter sp. SM1]
MFRKYLPQLLLVLAAVCVMMGLYIWQQPQETWLQAPAPLPDSLLSAFQDQKSSIKTEENPQARAHWEWLMLRDPATGKIPANIRQRELAFAKQLPVAKSTKPAIRKAETDWQSAGPFNIAGRTRALALDVRNEQIILAAGVSGGMWRSTDGGQSWVKTTAPDQLHNVTTVVQDTRPGHEDTWYYGTGELIGNSARGGDAPYRGDGIYKSTDNGVSWFQLAATSTNEPQAFDNPFDYVYKLKINTTNMAVQELYAAVAGGVYRSVDGGDTWTVAVVNDQSQSTDVEITSNGVVYVTLSAITLEGEVGEGGVFRSATNGNSWQSISARLWPPGFGRVKIGSNPQNPDELYFLGDGPDFPFLFRYRHAAGGGTWTNLTQNLPELEDPVAGLDLQGGYNMVVEVHPLQSNTVFVGGTNLFRSSDGFTSADNTDWIGGYSPENDVAVYPNHHPDQHELLFYPSNPSRAISAHDGGLSRTENILASNDDEIHEVEWQSLNSGYVTTQFYTVGLDQSQPTDLIIGGMQDNGSWLTNTATAANNRWIRLLGGDGGYTHVATRGAYYYVSFQESQIYRLTLNNEYRLTSFARIDPIGGGQIIEQPYLFINPYVFDPTSKNRMYLAAGNVVYRNRNVSQIPSGGQQPVSLNWDELPETSISSGSISAINISTTPADILYYGTSVGEVFRVTAANSTNPEVSPITSPLFPEAGYTAHISINPADANEIVVVFSNYNVRSIFHSNDGGENFSDISGNLEEFPSGEGSGPSVRHVEIIPLTDGTSLYLAGTSTGVYSTRTLSGLATRWEQEAPELIGRVVVPQIRHRSVDGRVVVATHGNGVYYKNYDDVLNTYIDPEGQPLNLLNPYPNPFTPADVVVIPFSVPRDGIVRVRVYSSTGQLIKLLLYNQVFAGTTEITWDGRNVAGVPVAPGTYVVRMEYENEVISKKVILLH